MSDRPRSGTPRASASGVSRSLWKSGFVRLGLVVLLVLGLYAVPALAQGTPPPAGTVIQPAQDPTALAPVIGQPPAAIAPASEARTPLRLNIALDGANAAELSVAVQIVLLMTLPARSRPRWCC